MHKSVALHSRRKTLNQRFDPILPCDLGLRETATEFGVTSYGVVGWACAQVRAMQAKDRRFRKRLEQVAFMISQQKT